MPALLRAPPGLRSEAGIPAVLRRCACGGECDECRKKQEGTLHRSAITTGPAFAPPIVHQVLSEPGQPLDGSTRGLMESHFGHDFSRVRVHTGDQASASAAAVAARAYAVGPDLVFGEGEWAPNSRRGQRLLAHELTHVVQQGTRTTTATLPIGAVDATEEAEAERAEQGIAQGRRGGSPSPVLRRQPKPSGTQPQAQPTGHCSVDQGKMLAEAIPSAMDWLHQAIGQLRNFETLPLIRSTRAARDAMQLHFHTTNPFHAQLVRERLQQVLDGISSNAAQADCAAPGDTGCGGGTMGYHQQGKIVWCPRIFAPPHGPTERAHTVVHEYAHAHARRVPVTSGYSEWPSGGERRVLDRAYRRERFYQDLTPEEAMDNADSYANLARDLGSGVTKRSMGELPPDDSITGCKPEQLEPIRKALSQAARWNTIALETINEPLLAQFPDLDALVTNAITREFGAKPPTRAEISTVFSLTGMQIGLVAYVGCDQKSKKCGSPVVRMWREGKSGEPQLCPSWFADPDVDRRARIMYSGMISFSNELLSNPVGNPLAYVRLAVALSELKLKRGEVAPPLPSEPFPTSQKPGEAIG